MPVEGDTAVFEPLTPESIKSYEGSSFAEPAVPFAEPAVPIAEPASPFAEPAVATPPTLGTDIELGRAALEAYYAPRPKTARQERKEGFEIVRLVIGLVLLAGGTTMTFSEGNILLGVFLLFCLAFGIAMVVFGTSKPKGDEKPGIIGYLENRGMLNEACADFPLEPDLQNDGARFGNRFVFKKGYYHIYRYTEFERIYLRETRMGNRAMLLSLVADLAGGRSVDLCSFPANEQGKTQALAVAVRIAAANPRIALGKA